MAKNLNSALIGAAGVHFVASELSLRGLIAMPTVRNAPGIDLMAATPDGSWRANVQVKTSLSRAKKFWLVGGNFRKFRGPGNYYVFVRWIQEEKRFEAFLETADRVIQVASCVEDIGRKKGKEWLPSWPLLKDFDSSLERARKQWTMFGVNRVRAES